MKTLIEGSQDILDCKKYFECFDCGWAGCAIKGEYNSETVCDFVYGLVYFVECPFCKEKAYEVEDNKKLEKLKELDRRIPNE